jgi:ornithine cyclodeaminase
MIALMQSTLPYLDADELFRLVPLADALTALRTCFAASPSHVDRVHCSAAGGEFLVMPAAAGDAAGVKLVGIQPANQARGLPIIQGVYVLFDMRVGNPVALLDGAALTTLRTPMISALATDALARRDVRTVGIIGTGPQAVAHVRAMRVVRPEIDHVVVAGRTSEHVDHVVDELVTAGETAMSGSYQGWRRATSCVRRPGRTQRCSDWPMSGRAPMSAWSVRTRLDLREVAADLVGGSTVVVDDTAAAQAEAGDLHLAVEEGAWAWDRIAGDLTDLASGRLRRHPSEITLSRASGLLFRIWRSPNAAAAAGILETR